MAYYRGKDIEKSRGNAIKELIIEKRSVAQVARRFGKDRSTIYRWNEKRPLPTAPGELIQTDTVHYVNPLNHSKMYIYTVIDLHTRMAYAKISPNLTEKGAAEAIFEAQEFMNFPFKMVQSDNGAEFQRRFQERLNTKGIRTRHSRVRHPNDDAHIERFNRTLRKECIGQYNPNNDINFINRKLNRFIKYYNYDRIHLGIGLRTPYEVLQRC